MGCYSTSGLNRSEGVDGYAKLVHALPQIAKQPAGGVQDTSVKFPIRLAVAQLGEMAVPEAALDPLRKRPDLFQSVISVPLQSIDRPTVPVPGYVLSDNSVYAFARDAVPPRSTEAIDKLKSTIDLAVASGADHLFIIGGQVEHKVQGNKLDILEYLILPSFIVPTQNVETNIRVAGTLVRCADGQILRTINVDDQETTIARKLWVSDAQFEQAESMRDGLSQDIAVALIAGLQTQR